MKIGIFAIYHVRFDDRSIEFPLGGSETWVIQLSDAFKALGNEVLVICNCQEHRISKSGVEYIPINEFAKTGGQTFDFMIVSRYLENFLRLWPNRDRNAGKVFLQLHDDSVPDTNNALVSTKYVDKIVVLTDWHKKFMSEKYSLGKGDTVVIPNPVDFSLFPDIDVKQKQVDHSILWSSCPTRGLEILATLVAPYVRKAIPDFSVKAVTYSSVEQKQYAGLKGVEWLVPMNKRQLYSEMYKHAVWFYPSVFDETFCITAAENAYVGNHLVMHPDFGTTLFEDVADVIVASFWNRFTLQSACLAAARRIVDRILNYDKYDALRLNARQFVENNFSPRRVAEMYIHAYEELCK